MLNTKPIIALDFPGEQDVLKFLGKKKKKLFHYPQNERRLP